MSTQEESSEALEGAMASDTVQIVELPDSVTNDMGITWGSDFNNNGVGICDKGKGESDALAFLEEAVRLCDKMLAGSEN